MERCVRKRKVIYMLDYNKEVGNRIKKARQRLNLTLNELGNKVGLTKSTVKRYEDGEIANLTVDTLKTFAQALEVDPGYLMGLKDYEDGKKIVVYGRICAGDGFLAYEDPIDEIICPYPRAKGDLIAFQVSGKSMNKIVDDGDYAIIRLQPSVENAEVCAVIIDNENAMLKRFYRVDEETIVLKPESTEPFQAHTFVGPEINRIRIIGKYIGAVKPPVI